MEVVLIREEAHCQPWRVVEWIRIGLPRDVNRENLSSYLNWLFFDFCPKPKRCRIGRGGYVHGGRLVQAHMGFSWAVGLDYHLDSYPRYHVVPKEGICLTKSKQQSYLRLKLDMHIDSAPHVVERGEEARALIELRLAEVMEQLSRRSELSLREAWTE